MKSLIAITTMLFTLGSFALSAQDDVVTDEQVSEEMTDYLHHLNGSSDSEEKRIKQLVLLKTLKDLWKIPEFRKLKSMEIKMILSSQRNNPYFRLALAFHHEDVQPFVQSLDSDQPIFNSVITFREKLRGGIYSFYQNFEGNDVGFDDAHPTHLQVVDASPPPQDIIGNNLNYHFTFVSIDLESLKHSLDYEHYVREQSILPYAYSILTPNFYLYETPETHLNGFYSKGHHMISFRSLLFTLPTTPSVVQLSPNQEIFAILLEDKNTELTLLNHFGADKHTIHNPSSDCRRCDETIAFAFSADSQALVTGTRGGDFNIFEFFQNSSDLLDIHAHAYPRGVTTLPIDRMALHPKHNMIAYSHRGDNWVHIFETKTKAENPIGYSLDRNAYIQSLLFTPSGELFIGAGNHIGIWNVETSQLIQTLYLKLNSSKSIVKILANKTGDYLAILFTNNQIEVYQKIPTLDLDLLLLANPDKVDPTKR